MRFTVSVYISLPETLNIVQLLTVFVLQFSLASPR
mgnify:CR=1 FL=1